MTNLERRILQHVHNAAARADFDWNAGCLLPEEMWSTLTASERVVIEDVLYGLFKRGFLAKRADSYYVPTAVGEQALSRP